MPTFGSDPTLVSDAGPAVPAQTRAVGQVLAGRYELRELLGSGGMGAVYRAHDRELDEVVALKLLHPEIAAQPGMLDRFRAEVKLARRVTHRNVARTFEFGEHAGLRFLTMEYVHGEPLSRRLREGPQPFVRAATWMLGVCEALAAAHVVGIVHRDIKPDNVLLEGDRVVVTDFGIARAGSEDPAALAGTPAYMAPEQLTGAPLSGRTDLYAVGVTLFEALTGQLPWTGDALPTSLARRLHEPSPDPRAVNPSIPALAADIVARLMAREPGDRYPDAAAAADALRDALARVSAGPSDLPAPRLGAPEPAGRSLALMPLRNLGADEDLVDGLAEDLLDALSTMRGVRVLGRGATLRFRGVERDARDIGRELGVDTLADGSVRRTPQGLRITLRLLDVATGFQTWSGRYDVGPDELLAIQDEAARAIFAALVPGAAAPVHQAPADPVARDLYLRGRHALHIVRSDDLLRALELFTAAHAREPDNPRICSGLSMALIRHSYFSPGLLADTVTRARSLATRAIDLAPQLGEPYMAMAHLALHESDGPGATRWARAAVARTPNLAEGHELLGRLLAEAGRVQEATRRLETALALDPLLDATLWEFVRLAAFAGDWPAVDRWIRRASPDGSRGGRWIFHIRYSVWRGDREALRQIERELPQANEPQRITYLIELLLRGYLHGESPRELTRSVTSGPVLDSFGPRLRQWLLQTQTELAAFHGDLELALEGLQSLEQTAFFDLLWLERCPLLAAVRQTPEFAVVRAAVAARADGIVEAMWG